MTSPSNSAVQNLLPVQAYFNADGSFNTFIGQGKPFYATSNPVQSGLTITNSTLDSSPIGATTPSTGAFTSFSTTTGTISTNASGATDIVNLLTLQSYAAGISWKNPVTAATTANITLSGPQTIDGVAVVAGNTVLVKNQTTSSQNGIYQVNAGAWTYATGCTTWAQYVSALVFVEYGGQAGSAWYCTAQPGGTLGTTAMTWSNFSVSSTYTAGTGLTLSGYQFSITPVGTAGTYGSASSVPVITTNASGQVSSVTNTSIAINGNQITSGTVGSSYISGSYTGITGVGTLTAGTWNASVISALYGGTGVAGTLTGVLYGNGTSAHTVATAAQLVSAIGTTAVTNSTNTTNLLGGAAGSLPYQSSANTTTFLAAGTNGQYLTLSSGVPTWTTLPTIVSSFSAGTTGFTPSTATTGAVTLSGTLNVANGGTGVTTSTGSGSNVLNTSPTLVTPILGSATATNLNIGTLTYTPANALISSQSSVSTYNQIILQNSNTGATASADFIVNNSNSTDSTYYGDFGMNSSGFTGSGAFNQANNVYLTSTTADLAIGTTTSNAIHFVVNGGATDAATITSGGQFQTTADASISGLTVGKGGGNTSTNTALGVSALATSPYGNTTGVGYQTLFGGGGGNETGLGYQVLYNATSSSGGNVGVGARALYSNTNGTSSVGVGYQALYSNTTLSNNTAVGYQAGYSNTAGVINAFGSGALYSNTSGTDISAFGVNTLYANTTGSENSAFGVASLRYNTTGSNNTAVGTTALYNNTTASNNTAVGYQAGYTNTTATGQTFIGYQAGYTSNGNYNTCIGEAAGYSLTTGVGNCFVSSGYSAAGYTVTTGSYNTVLGGYNGNQGGLNISTSSNYIVLSDGAGNPRGIFDNNGAFFVNGVFGSGAGISSTSATSAIQCFTAWNQGTSGTRYLHYFGSGATFSAVGSITYNGTNTLYNATSDQRLKENIVDAGSGLAKLANVKIRSFDWISNKQQVDFGLIAQELNDVAPEAVTQGIDNEDGSIDKPWQVDASALVPAMIKAIQELNAKVTALEAQLGA